MAFFWLQYLKWSLGKYRHPAILPIWHPVLEKHPCERQTRRIRARLTAFGRCAPFLRFSVKDSERRKRVIEGCRGREPFHHLHHHQCAPPHRRRSSTGSRGDPTFHSAIILASSESSRQIISNQFTAPLSYSHKYIQRFLWHYKREWGGESCLTGPGSRCNSQQKITAWRGCCVLWLVWASGHFKPPTSTGNVGILIREQAFGVGSRLLKPQHLFQSVWRHITSVHAENREANGATTSSCWIRIVSRGLSPLI